MTSYDTAASYISAHILSHLSRHRSSSSTPTTPLFVGIQGPQGSGKTYITSLLRELLTGEPHKLSVAVLSIDDLYLPYSGLQEVERLNGGNRLLKGRGLPGTHDVQLGKDILSALKSINENEAVSITLPVFEKSLHNGKGDRLPDGVLVKGPVDVVIMEGWCMGFCPISKDEIERRWPTMSDEMKVWCRKEDVKVVNDKLGEYADWWQFFDVFVQLKPPPLALPLSQYAIVYKWRLEQEHYMKAHNGGKGMTDEEVNSFVDRYIPGYIFFSSGITQGSELTGLKPRWIGRGLQVTIGEDREVLDVSEF